MCQISLHKVSLCSNGKNFKRIALQSYIMNKTGGNSKCQIRIPSQQKKEIIAPQHCVKNEFVCWLCVRECANCHFIWWRRILAQSGRRIEWEREWVREENNLDSDYQPALMQEEGNVSMATETTSQCVMWNWCWSLSRRRVHAVHLHAERPAPHHVATHWVLTAIPSHVGKIRGLSQAQPWHRRL